MLRVSSFSPRNRARYCGEQVADRIYRDYLETCRRLGVKPVTRIAVRQRSCATPSIGSALAYYSRIKEARRSDRCCFLPMEINHVFENWRLFVVLLSSFVQPTFADNATVKFTHMFVLGDSLSDQGNLFFATSDLGVAVNLAPIPAADHYYMGRFSNGENYAGLLAQKP